MRATPYLIQLLFVLLSAGALASDSAALERVYDGNQVGATAISLTDYFGVLEDPSGQLSLAEVSSGAQAARFNNQTVAAQALNFGYTQSTYWLRLKLSNSSPQAIARMLEIAYARIADLQFYQIDSDGSIHLTHTGTQLPFSARPYSHRYFVFPLTLPAHSQQSYYLRIQTKSPLLIPAQLWQLPAFHAYERSDYLAQAWYYGMASAMLLFNLLLFLALRDVIYLWYVNTVALTAWTIAEHNGLIEEFFQFNSPLWSEVSVGVGYSLAMVAMLLFTRRMLNLTSTAPRLDMGFKFVSTVFLLSPIGLLISYQSLIQAVTALYGIAGVLIISSALYCAYQRQRSAYFFLAAFSIIGAAGITNSLRLLGLLPTNLFTQNGLQLGSAIEMIIMAFALADRFNMIRREHEQVQESLLQAQMQVAVTLRESERVLERRVSERTAELSDNILHLQQTQAELLQAEKLASLGALVAGVAHELNTPIGNALTTATVLEETAKEFQLAVNNGALRKSTMLHFVEQSLPMTELISRSCKRAATLITSFKQIAVDQTTEQRRCFDLHSLVEDNIAALRPSFKTNKAKIHSHIAEGISFDSYPGPLGHVISNLVQNAMKHAFDEQEYGSLEIAARIDVDWVELSFIDNGKGMSAEVLARIFEPFYTTRLGQGGSGLGLSIALNIVTGVLGGSLSASSQAGLGAQFVLRLPLCAPYQAMP